VAGATLILLLSPSRDSAGFPRGKREMGAQEENLIIEVSNCTKIINWSLVF